MLCMSIFAERSVSPSKVFLNSNQNSNLRKGKKKKKKEEKEEKEGEEGEEEESK